MVASSLSAGALYAKCRAMYAKRLTEAQLAEMAAMTELSEICSYLKNRDAYSEAFAETSAARGMSIARFGALMKKALLLREERMLRYAALSDSGIEKYFALRNEVEIITERASVMGAAGFISSGYLYLPESAEKKLCFRVSEIENAKDARQLAKALSKTPYGKIISAASGKKQSFVHIQNALYKYLFERTADIVKENFGGAKRREILGFLSELSDITTLSELYRIKKYYPDNPLMTLHAFKSDLSSLGEKDFERLCAAPDTSKLEELFLKTKTGRLLYGIRDKDNLEKCAVYALCRKTLAFTDNPFVCAICFDELMRAECANVVTVAGGAASGLEPEKIMSLLVKER